MCNFQTNHASVAQIKYSVSLFVFLGLVRLKNSIKLGCVDICGWKALFYALIGWITATLVSEKPHHALFDGPDCVSTTTFNWS